MQRVKRTHEKGGYGSKGYRYDWELSEAAKNLLRTHTTAVSARMLYKLAQEVSKHCHLLIHVNAFYYLHFLAFFSPEGVQTPPLL